MNRSGWLVVVGFSLAGALVSCGYSSRAPCTDGDRQACGSSVGECKPGEQVCEDGKWSTCTGVVPTKDKCDNELDENCDGSVNEGCACTSGQERECGDPTAACGPGVQLCTDGRWESCRARGPEEEECDGRDNDCDGSRDEGCECGEGDDQACGNDMLPCVAGVQHCDDGRWGPCEDVSPETPRVLPKSEACDGEDNDCDGDRDENCRCRDGDEQECGNGMPPCVAGVQHCDDGRWGPCEDVSEETPRVLPQTEVCDGVDNDCDGDPDDACDCREGSERWCDGGLGPCQSGQETCDGGSWGPCEPLHERVAERCNGVDDDCNGVEDDGFELDVPCDSTNRCPQTRRCSEDGTSSACVDDDSLFASERCDGIDNDCDGIVDRVTAGGSLRSVCTCETRTLTIGSVVDASIAGGLNLCATTRCTSDRARGLLVDGTCYPACLTNSDPDGDGWGFENGRSCIVETSPRGRTAPPCDGIPLGMAMTYCLNCSGTGNLPYAMCQSVPRYDLTAFAEGTQWLKVDYSYASSAPARIPVNLWFHGGGDLRKRLPLVRIDDIPGHYEALLRVEEACFTPSAIFGSSCEGSGQSCTHCGGEEVCGAVEECGDYDLTQAWLQVAAEFCERGIGQQAGTVTVHSVELVEPNCAE